MDIKDVLPLIGVVFGWLLKELSDGFRQSGERHARIGKVLVRLLVLYDEIRRLKMDQEFMKDRRSMENYEQFRVAASRRYLDQRGKTLETVSEAIDLVASRWPFDALDLDNVKVMLTWYHKTNLGALASDREKYIKMLSSLEVSLLLAEKMLRRLVLKLALLHSPLTWIRVRWNWHKHETAAAKEGQEYTEKFLAEMLDGIDDKPEATPDTASTKNKEST